MWFNLAGHFSSSLISIAAYTSIRLTSFAGSSLIDFPGNFCSSVITSSDILTPGILVKRCWILQLQTYHLFWTLQLTSHQLLWIPMLQTRQLLCHYRFKKNNLCCMPPFGPHSHNYSKTREKTDGTFTLRAYATPIVMSWMVVAWISLVFARKHLKHPWWWYRQLYFFLDSYPHRPHHHAP